MLAKKGFVFITPDPPEDTTKSGLIYLPAGMKGVPKTGLVVHHHCTASWLYHGEEKLEGKRVVFDRWSGRPFKVVYNGKEYEFVTVSQWAILAIIESESEKETVQ